MGKRKLFQMAWFCCVFQNPAKVSQKEADEHSSKQWWRVWHSCLQFNSFYVSKLNISQINSLTSLILSNHLRYRLLLLLVKKAENQGEDVNSRRGKVKEFQSCWETVTKKLTFLSVFLYLTGTARNLFRLKEDVHILLWSLMNIKVSS